MSSGRHSMHCARLLRVTGTSPYASSSSEKLCARNLTLQKICGSGSSQPDFLRNEGPLNTLPSSLGAGPDQ
eukprot:1070547-Rhodomonas_salina.1